MVVVVFVCAWVVLGKGCVGKYEVGECVCEGGSEASGWVKFV